MVGGVIADKKGRVRAFFASFSYNTSDSESAVSAGMGAHLIRETIEQALGSQPPLRTLGVELKPMTLPDAVSRGLSPERVAQITGDKDQERKLLRVVRSETGHPAHISLQAGDILLSVDGRLITTHDVLEAALSGEVHELVILRGGTEQTQSVRTGVSQPATNRVLVWAGAYLHAPHPAARILSSMPANGVYVSRTWYGSPAARAELFSVSRITAVDGKPTPDLDAFIAAISQAPDRQGMKLSIEDHHGRRELITLEPDYTWWPTSELLRGEEGWTRTVLPSPEG
jgi:S1-C subfamily serine protease